MSANVYLVPHDFTEVGDTATDYAIKLASQTKAKVGILHIIAKDKERAEAETKIKAITADKRTKYPGISISAYVEKGSIFTDIGSMAEALDAALIVMGTHGAKGMQKVFGSFAIKVITSTSVPFLVVQGEVPKHDVNKIVFAMDLTLESLQVMTFAVDLAKEFDAEVHLVAKAETDATFARKIRNHMLVVTKKFDEAKLRYKTELLQGSGSYQSKVTKYASEEGADMIAISYHTDSLLPQFDRFAQAIITNNEKIPAMVVNSKEVGKGYF